MSITQQEVFEEPKKLRIDLSKNLTALNDNVMGLSGAVNTVKNSLLDVKEELKKSSESSSKYARALNWLTGVLAFCSIIQAILLAISILKNKV